MSLVPDEDPARPTTAFQTTETLKDRLAGTHSTDTDSLFLW